MPSKFSRKAVCRSRCKCVRLLSDEQCPSLQLQDMSILANIVMRGIGNMTVRNKLGK